MICDFFKNFASIENIKRKCYSMVDLLKFTSNKNILSEVVAISYNQFCNQTLFYYLWGNTISQLNLIGKYEKWAPRTMEIGSSSFQIYLLYGSIFYILDLAIYILPYHLLDLYNKIWIIFAPTRIMLAQFQDHTQHWFGSWPTASGQLL